MATFSRPILSLVPDGKLFFFFFSFFVLFLLLMEIFLVTVLNLSHGNGLNVIMKNY